MGIVILTALSVAGRFVLRWRREALGGFGLGRHNAPGILWNAGGRIFVWTLGQALCWGGAGALLAWYSWPWSLLALLLGFIFQGPLLRAVCGGDIAASQRLRAEREWKKGERVGDEDDDEGSEAEPTPDPIAQAFVALSALLAAAGQSLREEDRPSLLAPLKSLDEPGKERIAELLDGASTGFFHLAAKGHAFVPVQEIKDHFGSSLKENYPGASGSFLRFATTYWTYKLMQSALFPAHHQKAISQILLQIENDIASVFFPTPGPIVIPVKQREEAQREMIKASDAPIDIEDFIRGNPILRATP